ncbi:MAG: hypothetical protein ACT4PP_13600 [Sporichthyaceae bacterium]
MVAALASVGAGIIHAAVTPEHTNWWASVAFFVTLALFQLGWGGYVVLRKPTPLVLLLGAAVNLAALATWTVSRISGMPFGPHQGVAEPAARADIIASVLGVLVAVGALSIARDWRPRSLLTMRPALSAGAGGLAISALSLVALTGVSGHGHAIGEGDGHAGHTNDIQAAAATAPLTPAAAIAQCRRTAEVRTDAAFAKAATAANGKAAAIIKAEKAAKKMLKRELAKCATAPAPTKQVIEATPHPADGHGH